MATASNRRPRVRPMPIHAFCEKLLDHYKTTPTRKNYSTTWYVRVVATFLAKNPSAKTTSHLTTRIVEEFATSLGRYKESTRLEALKHFRAFCGHATDWGCLGRNPFDGYPLPSRRGRSPCGALRRGRKLDRDQVRDILEHMRDKADSWTGRRIYVFACLICHAGMTSRQARQLKVADCDFGAGVVLVRRRTATPRAIHAPQDLMETLAEWIPLRGQGKPDRAPQARYGTRLAEDGRTLVDDTKEQGVVAEMRRWRREGWSLDRIARELDRRGIPTKAGAKKWPPSTVGKILARGWQPDAKSTAGAGDHKRTEPKPDLGYVFTTVSGAGYWADVSGEVRHQIREAGEASGIEGLTVDSLRQFYLDEARTVLDLGSDGRGPGSGRNEAARQAAPAPVEPTARRCPVVAFDQDGLPLVRGIRVKAVTDKTRKILDYVIAAGPEGVGWPELGVATYRGCWHTLSDLKKSDPAWDSAIIFPGQGKKGVHIKDS